MGELNNGSQAESASQAESISQAPIDNSSPFDIQVPSINEVSGRVYNPIEEAKKEEVIYIYIYIYRKKNYLKLIQ